MVTDWWVCGWNARGFNVGSECFCFGGVGRNIGGVFIIVIIGLGGIGGDCRIIACWSDARYS